jgi:hypothetical protein
MVRKGAARRHLLRPNSPRNTGGITVAACGQRGDQHFYTRDPADVDCLACKRTLFMADAELRKQQRKKNR